jgi:hypothetical protein
LYSSSRAARWRDTTKAEMDNHLRAFALDGLRTLMLAMKEVRIRFMYKLALIFFYVRTAMKEVTPFPRKLVSIPASSSPRV